MHLHRASSLIQRLILGLFLGVLWPTVTTADPSDSKDSSKSWPGFRGDQQSTGFASDPLPKTLSVLWQFKAEGKNRGFDATPVIVDGTVYIADLGNFDGRVYALDAATGEKRWQFTTDSDFVAAAAVKLLTCNTSTLAAWMM